MNISLLRSDVIYRKMINVPKEKREVDETQQKQIQLISEDCLWNECKKTIEKGLECFIKAGYELPVKDYLFALMLANPKSPYVSLSDGYLGDGGIPGYALLCRVCLWLSYD